MTKEVYFDILKNELSASIKKFDFIDPVNLNKFYYKYYQDNDPKHKSIYLSSGYNTTVPKLLIRCPKSWY